MASKKTDKRELQSLVKKFTVEVIAAGCLIEKSGKVYPSRTGAYVHTLTKNEQKLRSKQVKEIGEFFSNGWYKSINRKIAGIPVKEWLNISSEDIALVEKFHPIKKNWTCYYGIDLCGNPLKISDFNSDRATVVGFQEEFIEIFKEYYPSSNFKGFYSAIIPKIKEISGKDNPRVFVLTYIQEPYRVAITNFAKKFDFHIGSIDQFEPKNYDIVIRQVKSIEIISNIKKYKKLLNALSNGLPMINPLGSYISGHKGWMTIICALDLMPCEWFPKSWLINGKLSKVLDNEGSVYNLDDLKDKFMDGDSVNNRKKYVLKKGFGAGGGEVYIGEDLKKYEWKEVWDEVLTSKASWVVEEKLPKNTIEIMIGDPVANSNEINVSNQRLNIIERIYSVHPFGNYFGEVFGKQLNKVNASGYTFPVSFS